MAFHKFNFDSQLLEGLSSMGFNNPTPIQEKAIPIILQGKDIIACAQTGTGKTGAYILPILDKIVRNPQRQLNTVVIAPTRELAQQIDQQIEGFGYFLGISSIPVYGGGDGAAWDQQRKALEEGADIIIATPGRLIALLAGGTVPMEHLQHLVLDEADRMLDMGFNEDIMRIMRYMPASRQTLLFSATMPPKIRALASKILRDPVEINIAIAQPAEGILQQAYYVHDQQKIPLLKSILKNPDFTSIIIFANSKESVKRLGRELKPSGKEVKAFHSDLEQKEREQILREFKSKQFSVLIGTDILSRGIDVEGISLVVNFDTPHDPEDYVHRIGRTARAESTGTAITFVNPKDQRKFLAVERLISSNVQVVKLPEELGAGPLYLPDKKSNHKNRSSDPRKRQRFHRKPRS